MAAAEKAFAQVGVIGWIMCHLSHSYYTGACGSSAASRARKPDDGAIAHLR
jgi:hypothetical protein